MFDAPQYPTYYPLIWNPESKQTTAGQVLMECLPEADGGSCEASQLHIPEGLFTPGENLAATVFFLFTNGAQIKILTQ